MENVEKALQAELDTIEEPTDIGRAINNICYSAEETGVLPCRVDEEMAITIWKLVEIAKKYKGKLPDNLKM